MNQDGEVNIGDVTALISAILSATPTTVFDPNADVNQDGEISIGDVTALISIILKS